MIYDNGIYREETPEEIAECERLQKEWEQEQSQNPAPPTDSERLEALENQLAGIVSAYREGVNNA